LVSGASGEFRQSFATRAGIDALGDGSREICAAISGDVGAPLAGARRWSATDDPIRPHPQAGANRHSCPMALPTLLWLFASRGSVKCVDTAA
jgi:hypothetical protein